MPQILTIGGGELSAGLRMAALLAGCEFVRAAGNVDAVRLARSRAIDDTGTTS